MQEIARISMTLARSIFEGINFIFSTKLYGIYVTTHLLMTIENAWLYLNQAFSIRFTRF